MTRLTLAAACAVACVVIAARPVPLAGEESRDERFGELVGSVESLLEAGLGSTDVAPWWALARPVEPLVDEGQSIDGRIVIRGVAADGSARWISLDRSELVHAPADRAFAGWREPEAAGEEDRAGWDRRARAIATPLWTQGERDPLRPPVLKDNGAVALGAWVALRRGTAAQADSIARARGRSTVGVAGPITDEFLEAARSNLEWWLAASVVRRFAKGFGTRADAVEALRRLCAVEPTRSSPADALLERLAVPAATDGATSPLRDALAEGAWTRPNLTICDEVRFDAESSPPAGRLFRAPASVRWDMVPQLVGLVGDAYASRSVTGTSDWHAWHFKLLDVNSVGEVADRLLMDLTRGIRRQFVIEPLVDFRTRRAKAAADADAWWNAVRRIGIDTHLRSLAALGRPEAAEDLVERTGAIDATTLRAGTAAAPESERWRFHRLAARCTDRQAAREVLPPWDPRRYHADDLLGAYAVIEGGPGVARLRAAWQAATAPAGAARMPHVPASILGGVLLSGTDLLGDWDEVVTRLPPSARAAVIERLPDPEWIESAATRRNVIRALAACLFDERDGDSPEWLDGSVNGSPHVGQGSRLCDLAATRLVGVVAPLRSFSARQPKAARDAAIAEARRDLLPALDTPLPRPPLAGVRIRGRAAAEWDGEGPAPETAWAEACSKAAADPLALPALVEMLAGAPAEKNGASRVAWIAAEWTTRGPAEPAEFRCSVQTNGVGGTDGRLYVVTELPDGSGVARTVKGVDPTPGSRSWSVKAERISRQLGVNRARLGECSLRIAFRFW